MGIVMMGPSYWTSPAEVEMVEMEQMKAKARVKEEEEGTSGVGVCMVMMGPSTWTSKWLRRQYWVDNTIANDDNPCPLTLSFFSGRISGIKTDGRGGGNVGDNRGRGGRGVG